MSRLDEIKARAEQVHWTSTSVEQAMVRMASSAADVPWLVSEVARLTAERDALAAQVARVEALAGQWERLADTAINPNSREWLQACAATLRQCLSGWQKMHVALAGSEADTTDTQSITHESEEDADA